MQAGPKALAWMGGWHRRAHPAGRRAGRHAAWAAIVALLRDRFNANEILVSLMLVYVADMLLSLAGLRPLEGPCGLQLPADQDLRRGRKHPAPGAPAGCALNIGC